MKDGRYKDQRVAVLGAGLSGSAAAMLLASEGAKVTVLDSAEETDFTEIYPGKSSGTRDCSNLRPRSAQTFAGVSVGGPKSRHRSGFSVSAKFFITRNRNDR